LLSAILFLHPAQRRGSSLQLNKPSKPFIQSRFPVQQQTIASSFDKLQERI
jgi:hypothetical protein